MLSCQSAGKRCKKIAGAGDIPLEANTGTTCPKEPLCLQDLLQGSYPSSDVWLVSNRGFCVVMGLPSSGAAKISVRQGCEVRQRPDPQRCLHQKEDGVKLDPWLCITLSDSEQGKLIRGRRFKRSRVQENCEKSGFKVERGRGHNKSTTTRATAISGMLVLMHKIHINSHFGLCRVRFSKENGF